MNTFTSYLPSVFIVLVLALLPPCLRAQPVDEESAPKLLALIIGNSTYNSAAGQLAGPDNDAADMAAVLNKIGFKISNKGNITNLDRKSMFDALDKFIDEVDEDTIALVYYSGHGLEDAHKNFLVPVDANIKSVGDIALQLVPLDWIMERLGQREARTKLVILDACRSMPTGLYKKLGDSSGLAQITKLRPGTRVIYSASPTFPSLAAGPGERNSIYTASLLKAIKERHLTFEAILNRASALTYQATNKQQYPWSSGNQMDFNIDVGLANNPLSQKPDTQLAAKKVIAPRAKNGACVEISEQLIVNGVATWTKKCI